MSYKKPKTHQSIARERIKELFLQAEMIFPTKPELSNRYVFLARKIAMKYKVIIPSEQKMRFCKECHTYLTPGVNSRVRLQEKKVVVYCMQCKHFMRYPYKPARQAKRE